MPGPRHANQPHVREEGSEDGVVRLPSSVLNACSVERKVGEGVALDVGGVATIDDEGGLGELGRPPRKVRRLVQREVHELGEACVQQSIAASHSSGPGYICGWQ